MSLAVVLNVILIKNTYKTITSTRILYMTYIILLHKYMYYKYSYKYV